MNVSTNNEDSPPDPSPQSGSIMQNLINKLRVLLRLHGNSSLKESVEEAIEDHDAMEGNASGGEEKALLRNVLSFSELNVEDVMIPRADINGMEIDTPYGEIKKMILDNAHTRIPVFRQTLDDVVGFIHIKDLLTIAYTQQKNSSELFEIAKIIRQCLFVPPSMKTSALLVKMQLSHVHIAIVVDEYGGTTGLVTLEDLVEEIVGEIEDEHDRVDDIMFTPLGNDLFEASARINIDELEEKMGISLCRDDKDEDFDTLGGLIFSILGRIPALGEVASRTSSDGVFEIEFEVSDADMRRVKRVIIRRKPV